VIDFPRDIQPILDTHCIQCHSPEKREGNVSLIGNRSPLYSISYFTITAKSLVADGRNLARSNYPPRVLGTGSSKLLQFCDESHYGVKLSDQEMATIRLWIDTGATYPGTYAALGSGMVGGYARNTMDRRDLQWAEIQAMQQTLTENCTSCHTKERNIQLPLSPSDEIGNPPWVPLSPNDVRRKFARHLLYDLTEPERSALLLGPLATSAGGYESCGSAILTNRDDPRYQAILSGITRTKQHLDEIKRFDMPGFVPRPEYIREMKRYGMLPMNHDPSTVVDFYDLDQEYWRSLWYVPQK
jgi:mono/diheme cytochrome c family protein